MAKPGGVTKRGSFSKDPRTQRFPAANGRGGYKHNRAGFYNYILKKPLKGLYRWSFIAAALQIDMDSSWEITVNVAGKTIPISCGEGSCTSEYD